MSVLGFAISRQWQDPWPELIPEATWRVPGYEESERPRIVSFTYHLDPDPQLRQTAAGRSVIVHRVSEGLTCAFVTEQTLPISTASVLTVEGLLVEMSGQWFADRVRQLHEWSQEDQDEAAIVPESLHHMMEFWAQNRTLPEPDVFVSHEGFLANTWENERGIVDIEFLPLTKSVKWIRLDRTVDPAQSITQGTKLTEAVAEFVRQCI